MSMKQGAEDGASQQGAGSDSSPAFRLLSRGQRPVAVREAWFKRLGSPVNMHGLFSTLAVNVPNLIQYLGSILSLSPASNFCPIEFHANRSLPEHPAEEAAAPSPR